MTDAPASGAPWRNFYGRFKGKALRPEQQRRMEEELPRLALPGVDWATNPDRTPLELEGEIWLEIGFGSGEHMVHQAAANPNVTIIGCEPYLNGVAVALGKIAAKGLTNIRLHPGDARDLLDVIPAERLTKAFLLYPDPWPKSRHHRRRFVTPDHLIPLARALQPDAEFRVATDIPDYVRQTLLEAPRAGFNWQANGPDDWRSAWPDWLSTRYEQKALREGRTPHYMTFRRRPGMVFLTGTMTAGDDAQIVRDALPDHIRLSNAEPGCLHFDVAEDSARPGLFHVLEAFTDPAAFQAHQTRTRASDWWQKTGHLPRNFTTSP